MILISHRGNISGPDAKSENHPDYLKRAVKMGYNVEMDVWHREKKWYLGHDEPQYKIDMTFLLNDFFWCHAKNVEVFKEMLSRGIHCFWHQEDDVALTSRGYIWTYPGKKLTTKSICVSPEKQKIKTFDCMGICSDYIENYKNL